MDPFYKIEGNYLYLNIKVVPGASRSELGEANGDKLKVRVAAPPEDGKANNELRAFLAKTFKVPKRDVIIASGEKSRIKILRLPVTVKEFYKKLG